MPQDTESKLGCFDLNLRSLNKDEYIISEDVRKDFNSDLSSAQREKELKTEQGTPHHEKDHENERHIRVDCKIEIQFGPKILSSPEQEPFQIRNIIARDQHFREHSLML